MSWSGMGGSGWRQAYHLDLYVEEALAAAELTGLFDSPTKPTFLGHSFGGYVLTRLAAQEGRRLGRIILLDSGLTSFHHTADAPKARLYASLEAALARFRLEPAQACEPYLADWYARKGLKTVHAQDGGALWTWRFDPDLLPKMGAVNVESDLPAAKCPVTFIRGELSTVVSPAVEARQRQTAPRDSQFITVPNAGHHLMADQPLALAALLDRLC